MIRAGSPELQLDQSDCASASDPLDAMASAAKKAAVTPRPYLKAMPLAMCAAVNSNPTAPANRAENASALRRSSGGLGRTKRDGRTRPEALRSLAGTVPGRPPPLGLARATPAVPSLITAAGGVPHAFLRVL